MVCCHFNVLYLRPYLQPMEVTKVSQTLHLAMFDKLTISLVN